MTNPSWTSTRGQISPMYCTLNNLSVLVIRKGNPMSEYVTFSPYSLRHGWHVYLKNQDDVAAQLVGFFQQFLEVFPEIKGKKLWLSGESVRACVFSGWYILRHSSVRWNVRALCVYLLANHSDRSAELISRPCQLYLRKPDFARPISSGHMAC